MAWGAEVLAELPHEIVDQGPDGRTRPQVVMRDPEVSRGIRTVRRPGQVTDLSEAIPEDPRPVRGVATEETVAAQEAPQAT